MSYLPTLIAALQFYRTGSTVTIDDLRNELTTYGQVPAEALGPTFAEAVTKGYLAVTGQTVKTRWRPGKGRLVRVYLITAKARRDGRAAA